MSICQCHWRNPGRDRSGAKRMSVHVILVYMLDCKCGGWVLNLRMPDKHIYLQDRVDQRVAKVNTHLKALLQSIKNPHVFEGKCNEILHLLDKWGIAETGVGRAVYPELIRLLEEARDMAVIRDEKDNTYIGIRNDYTESKASSIAGKIKRTWNELQKILEERHLAIKMKMQYHNSKNHPRNHVHVCSQCGLLKFSDYADKRTLHSVTP